MPVQALHRTKRDAEDWSRRTEDEMVRGAYIQRAAADRMTVADALKQYLADVTPTKRPMSQTSDQGHAKPLTKSLGRYSLAALTPELIARHRDARLSGEDRKDKEGNPIPRAANTVRLDLALLGHMYSVAIKEWGIGLSSNPVMNIRKPAPAPGRDRRLTPDEETRLMEAIDKHSNPMLRWIVRIALATGMRSSEITGLRRMQVDLNRRIVRLLETKNTTCLVLQCDGPSELSNRSEPASKCTLKPGQPQPKQRVSKSLSSNPGSLNGRVDAALS